MRALLERRHRRAHPRRSTRRSPPTCSTRPRPATCSTSSSTRYAQPRLPDGDVGARGPARLRRRRGDAGRSRPPGGRWPSTPSSPRCWRALDAQGLRGAARRHRGARWCGCWPAWRSSASASTSSACGASTTRWRRECERLTEEIWADAGEEFNVNSTAAAARACCSTSSGLTPQKKTKTGLLHRRRLAREAGGRAPDHRAPAALPRGREAALDLRRGPARRGRARTGASTPRSTRRWPAPAGSAPTHPTCTTSRCAARWVAAFRHGVRAGPGLRVPGRRLQPDRAALHRPPRRGSRA